MTSADANEEIRSCWHRMTAPQLAEHLAGMGVTLAPSSIKQRACRMRLPRKRAGRVGTVSHGTRWQYMKGCRCEPCREAARAYNREASRRRRGGLKSRAPAPCGTEAKYGRGCRCEPCTLAHADYHVARTGAIGHGSLNRAMAGCPCPRCARTRQGRESRPKGPPAWRCPCDPYRLNAGDVTTCPACGTVPMWATDRDQRRMTG